MKKLLILITIFSSLACAIQPYNQDGTRNKQYWKTLKEVEGKWIDFNENLVLGLCVEISENKKNKVKVILFDETSEHLLITKYENNALTIVFEENEELLFKLDPTLKIMSTDQKLGNLYFKLSLMREQDLKEKIKKLTSE